MKKKTETWIEFARRDLLAVEKLLDDVEFTNIVAFHSQQSVEKILKACLEEFEVEIPRVHNLIRLYELLPTEYVASLKINREELHLLNRVYTESRYPPDFGLLPTGLPTRDEAKQIFEIAKKMYYAILQSLRQR